MARTDLRVLYGRDRGLFEGPRYLPGLGLVFADARNGGVLRLGDGGTVEPVVEHRRGIGGLVPHQDGGFVVTGRNVAHKPSTGETVVLLDRDFSVHRVGFNDLTTDAMGRVYVGALGVVATEANLDDPNLPPGSLYLIDTDGSSRIVAEDIRLTNGVAPSPDGRRLYLSDSGRRTVFRFDVDATTGDLGNRQAFLENTDGVPDGIAIAEDGSVWVAHAYAGKVARYAPDSRLIESIGLPVEMVTSLCFGGEDLRTLFIVTGVENADVGGDAFVYALDVDVAGAPVSMAATPTTAVNAVNG